MALDHMHCDSFEEHKAHKWLLEYTKQGRPCAYYVDCDGTRKTDAEFIKWAEEIMGVPLEDWQKMYFLKNFPNQEKFKAKLEEQRGK